MEDIVRASQRDLHHALGILEVVALCVPGIMSKGFAYILLFAFLATMLAINLNTLHNFLKRRHKGGYSL